MSARKGPTPDLSRIFAAAQAIAIFNFSMRRPPKSSDVGDVLEFILPDSGTWNGNRVIQLLDQAVEAGIVKKLDTSPVTWSASPDKIDMNILTSYLVRRLD